MPRRQEESLNKMIWDLAKKYASEEKHVLFVEEVSVKIFDMLKDRFELGAEDRLLLRHACILHDIGHFVNERRHHKHAKYLIENDSLMDAYPKKKKALLGLMAYNHRKKVHKDVALLQKKEAERVLMLSGILRLADALHYTREEILVKEIMIGENTLLISIEGVLPERFRQESFARKKELFQNIFGLEIRLVNEISG